MIFSLFQDHYDNEKNIVYRFDCLNIGCRNHPFNS